MPSYDFSSWPNEPESEVWADYETLRKKLRAPITKTVIKSMGKKLHILKGMGWSVDEALTEMCDFGYRGLKPEMFKPKIRTAKDGDNSQFYTDVEDGPKMD